MAAPGALATLSVAALAALAALSPPATLAPCVAKYNTTQRGASDHVWWVRTGAQGRVDLVLQCPRLSVLLWIRLSQG